MRVSQARPFRQRTTTKIKRATRGGGGDNQKILVSRRSPPDVTQARNACILRITFLRFLSNKFSTDYSNSIKAGSDFAFGKIDFLGLERYDDK